jgi:hypothetical protein
VLFERDHPELHLLTELRLGISLDPRKEYARELSEAGDARLSRNWDSVYCN